MSSIPTNDYAKMPPSEELWDSDSGSNDDDGGIDAKDMPTQWQSDFDFPHRSQMIQNIVDILTQMNENATSGWKEKLPSMVEQLEGTLYINAPTLEDYLDEGTLMERLKSLAIALSKDMGLDVARTCEEVNEKLSHLSFDS